MHPNGVSRPSVRTTKEKYFYCLKGSKNQGKVTAMKKATLHLNGVSKADAETVEGKALSPMRFHG